MNLPKNPADVHAALAAAYNSGDINSVMQIYDGNGVIVPEPGKAVSGAKDFEAAVKGILAIKGKMEIKTVYCLQSGNVAVGRSEWNITDGKEVKVCAKGIEVMVQQADGTWRVLIDHAFGALENLTVLI